MGVRFGASIKGLNENPETGNPKNIVGKSWAYTYQGPGVPNIYIYIYIYIYTYTIFLGFPVWGPKP